MELLYNPDSMPEEEVKATFVARQWLVDELASLIKRQPDGAGVQHILIIAPRGMGKTTVLLMAKFAINDGNLSKRWHAVKFPEESYGIYDLADFWLEVLAIVAADTNDEQLQKQVEDLRSTFPDNNDLQEAALALIKDWRRKHKKRLVLLVDNIDMILGQINDERDEARLRDVLMNDGAMMIVGCALSFFDEARSYEKPLYNFFKTYDLAKLKFEQIQELLLRRARLDGVENFEETLKANKTRLRVLEYFTGGNPRLVLMLYRVVTQSDISEVHRGLEKLLDEVTPYFKAKVESLPAQLRKILDHIARVSSKTNEGLTPTDIARAVRLTSNQVSSQLKRLADMGYVRSANLRSRSSHYVLSEPLYAIWHQMRFGRDARERMQWLVNFIKAYYDAEEIGAESARLELRFRALLSAGQTAKALDVLEHRRYLAEAMDDSENRANTMDAVAHGIIALVDTDTIRKQLLNTIDLTTLSPETLLSLYRLGGIVEHPLQTVLSQLSVSKVSTKVKKIARAMELARKALQAKKWDEVLNHWDRVIKLYPNLPLAWSMKGGALAELTKYEEAIESCDRALQIDPNSPGAWGIRGIAFHNLENYEEAIASYDRVLETKPNDETACLYRGRALAKKGEHREAVDSYDRALEINPTNHDTWGYRGDSLAQLGNYKEALASFNQSLKIELSRDGWYCRGRALDHLGRYDEAVESYDRGLEIDPNDAVALSSRGASLAVLRRYEEAIASSESALNIAPGNTHAWYVRAIAFLLKFTKSITQDKADQARKEWAEAVNSSPHLEKTDWHALAEEQLRAVAHAGHLEFVRQLIEEAALQEPLFPLTRAVDYLLSGDEALIEKLSPEVRGIVEEVVADLRHGAKRSAVTKTTMGGDSTLRKKPRVDRSKSALRNRRGDGCREIQRSLFAPDAHTEEPFRLTGRDASVRTSDEIEPNEEKTVNVN